MMLSVENTSPKLLFLIFIPNFLSACVLSKCHIIHMVNVVLFPLWREANSGEAGSSEFAP